MKICIVGGSSGIGRATIQQLRSQHTVINLSRRVNTEAHYNYYCDVRDYNSVRNAFDKIHEEIGIIDGLMYSAGFTEPSFLVDLESDVWDNIIATNLSGAFYCTKEFVKRSTKNSKIVYMASTAGTRPQPQWSAYASSKAGLINFGLTRYFLCLQ